MAVALGVVLTTVGGGLLAGLTGTASAENDLRAAANSGPSPTDEPTKEPFVSERSRRLDKADTPKTSVTAPHGRSAYAGAPSRLLIPSLDVDSAVIPIASSDGVLLPPSDPQTLGWWNGGAVPGAAKGGALITGHTVHTGGGSFDDLETLEAGDKVTVRTSAGDVKYRVTAMSIYRKASLAENAQKVFSQSVPGRLVLVTCEDWDGSKYLSNVVVFADPT